MVAVKNRFDSIISFGRVAMIAGFSKGISGEVFD